jgi:cobalt-zinc-cadmium efflux system protein
MHGHTHRHASSDTAVIGASFARLRLALAVTLLFMLVEFAGGLLSNSLALLADAGHMLSDGAALALSLFAVWFSRQPVTAEKSYGYLRWEILAALINGSALLLLCAWIAWEAVSRLYAPQDVNAITMAIVAAVGLCANGAAAWTLRPLTGSSLNVRGAYLHVMGDLLASGGTLIAAVVLATTGFAAADSIASLLTAALIVRGAWQLVRESVDVLLEATPSHISSDRVRASLEGIAGIDSVHDLHIWAVSSGLIAMSAHAVVREPGIQQQVLERIHDTLRGFGINHVTVQLESGEMPDCARGLH